LAAVAAAAAAAAITVRRLALFYSLINAARALQSLRPTQSSSHRRRDGRGVTSGDVMSAHGAVAGDAGDARPADGVTSTGAVRERPRKSTTSTATTTQLRR